MLFLFRVGEVQVLFRAFVVREPGSVGLVALWATRAAAEAAVAPATLARTEKTIGARTRETTLFEAPLLVDATLRAGRAP